MIAIRARERAQLVGLISAIDNVNVYNYVYVHRASSLTLLDYSHEILTYWSSFYIVARRVGFGFFL